MPDSLPPQPTLSDGVVVLRPWRDDDIAEAIAGHDEEIAHWFGFPVVQPSYEQHRAAVEDWRRWYAEGRSRVSFVVEHDGRLVGSVEVQDRGNRTARLSWVLYSGHRGQGFATRAVRLLIGYALDELDMQRVEAEVEPGNERSLRVATRAGMHREGVKRVAPGTGDRPETTEYVVLARLASDPPLSDPTGFRTLLNSFLPRKRAIAQMLLRDPEDRVLLCELTYKRDWDLPGGVVEVGESPQLAAVREVEEELGLKLPIGPLVLTDWLPPWGGWEDALCLVFDGGVHAPDVLHDVVKQEREIRSARFCTVEEVRDRATDFTARRVEAALRNLSADPGGTRPYTESGR
ncbi:NUDIX hydrolase [Nocardioides mesophilus]|uniref:NUDIX hydrolase n=1 Tax=Nocardioides mesophilus TaxID=433659 RepID=A0A7G9R8T4_9ACTN|nr:NUDIX hydrolase [Nocardioides mesophilus]QNN52009.1 NUDIX hydrolase [Nocardioides mesophilus]